MSAPSKTTVEASDPSASGALAVADEALGAGQTNVEKAAHEAGEEGSPESGEDEYVDSPQDWKCTKDPKTGRRYWWNTVTKETSWISPAKRREKAITAQAQQVFREFDSDGSGSISIEELGAALEKFGLKLSSASLKMIVRRYDADGSGTLDVAEWTSLALDALASSTSGTDDLAQSLAVYSKRMPVKDIKMAKGYPLPPTTVTAAGDEEGCVVWWSLPSAAAANIQPPVAYIIRRYRLQAGTWTFKGETEFASTENQQRISSMKHGQSYRFTVVTVNTLGRSSESQPSNAVKRDEQLPAGWTEHFDDGSQRHFYYNKRTGVRTWVRPNLDPYCIDEDLFLKFSPEEMAHFKRVYQELDTDYSGCLDHEELIALLPHIGERVRPDDVQTLFYHFDKDASGELDFQEAVQMFLFLKEARMARRSKWERYADNKIARKEAKLNPTITASERDLLITDEGTKMGAWQKIKHPVLDRHYYHNPSTKETTWLVPDEIKLFVSKKLSDKLMEFFTPADMIDLEDKFNQLDLDGSGTIDEDEIRMILESMGEKATNSRIQSLIHEIDLDGSGLIDFEEFCMMMLAFRRRRGISGSWSRIADRIQKEDSWLADLKSGFSKFKEKLQRARSARDKHVKNPHGRYCMCGCRSFDPTVKIKKSYFWWLCACGCSPCKYFGSCCPWWCCCLCRNCCGCLDCFPREKNLFEKVADWELRRRDLKVERDKLLAKKLLANKEAARTHDHAGQAMH